MIMLCCENMLTPQHLIETQGTRDRDAKFVDMLSSIGGTMGPLTSFIASGVEIIYLLEV